MKWECFCDAVYYKLWAVKPVDCGDFHQTIHVNTKEEAEFLVERLNNSVSLPIVAELVDSWFKCGELTVFQHDEIIKEIKQKAGL